MSHWFKDPYNIALCSLLILFPAIYFAVLICLSIRISLFVIYVYCRKRALCITWFLNSLLVAVSQSSVHQITTYLGLRSLGLSVTKKGTLTISKKRSAYMFMKFPREDLNLGYCPPTPQEFIFIKWPSCQGCLAGWRITISFSLVYWSSNSRSFGLCSTQKKIIGEANK